MSQRPPANQRGNGGELELMKQLAWEAASLVRRVRQEGFTVEEKGPNDPVTRADREANTLICQALQARFSHHGVIGEESGQSAEALAAAQDRERVFFVDPVDGTREFAEGRPDYCVMVGLAVGGRAELGVIAIPEEDCMLWGGRQVGAFFERRGEPARRLVLESLSDATLARAVVSRSHPAPATEAALARLGITHITPMGSVGVKAAQVIRGEAQLYIHKSAGTKLWDACAPEALLAGAGGVLLDIEGKPIDYLGPLAIGGGLLATGPGLLRAVLAALKG